MAAAGCHELQAAWHPRAERRGSELGSWAKQTRWRQAELEQPSEGSRGLRSHEPARARGGIVQSRGVGPQRSSGLVGRRREAQGLQPKGAQAGEATRGGGLRGGVGEAPTPGGGLRGGAREATIGAMEGSDWVLGGGRRATALTQLGSPRSRGDREQRCSRAEELGSHGSKGWQDPAAGWRDPAAGSSGGGARVGREVEREEERKVAATSGRRRLSLSLSHKP